MKMHPYWINTPGSLGVGITAYSKADALHQFVLAFGKEAQHGAPTPITDLADLDQDHVIPNMGNHLKRGVWFPLGLDQVPSSCPGDSGF